MCGEGCDDIPTIHLNLKLRNKLLAIKKIVLFTQLIKFNVTSWTLFDVRSSVIFFNEINDGSDISSGERRIGGEGGRETVIKVLGMWCDTP